MSKIVILDGYTTNPGDLSWEPFREFGELTVFDRTPASEILTRAGGADIILTNKTPLTRETMSSLPGLKYIGAMSTGWNVIDAEAAKEMGITVTNIPEYATFATAQLTAALLLELANRVGNHDRLVHAGAWADSADFSFTDGTLIELSSKTLGLVGYGKIARRVAVIAQALGMHVMATSRTIEKHLASGEMQPRTAGADGVTYVTLDALLRKSDFISFHCPLTKETQGLVSRNTISRMKDGVFLINTSRGPVFDENDVAEALRTGKIAGAAVDVLSSEPPLPGNPLLTAPNCIITPHIAWTPKETRQRLMDTLCENIRNYLSGKPCSTVI